MRTASRGWNGTSGTWRRHCACGAFLALGALALVTGCGDEESRKFRQAAFPAIESGVKSVADGILTGIFTLNSASSSSSSSSSGS